jgi:clostripain
MIESVLLGLAAALAAPADDRAPAAWTILFYGAANNSCEKDILGSIEEMKQGFADGQGVELVVLLDRMAGFSNDAETLGENFEDTRLFRIGHASFERLDGGPEFPEITKTSTFEADMGDAETLRKLVRFGKAHFPARHYAVVFFSHGNGRCFAQDDDSRGDALFPAELTDVLAESDSVDLLGFDVCSMGGIENAYQWRPAPGKFGAAAMVASAPVSGPWPYAPILKRLCTPAAATLDAIALGKLIVEEKEAQARRMPAQAQKKLGFESWACYDLAKTEAAKKAVDALASALAKAPNAKEVVSKIRGSGKTTPTTNYMPPGEDAWTTMPFFDLHDLAKRIAASDALPADVRERAAAAARAADDVVVASYLTDPDARFDRDADGLYVVFPDGDARELLGRHWSSFGWYTGEDLSAKRGLWGKLAWCRDGATPGNGVVENWFELLASWFDAPSETRRW